MAQPILNAQQLAIFILKFTLRLTKNKLSAWVGLCSELRIEHSAGDVILALEADGVELAQFLYYLTDSGEHEIKFSGPDLLDMSIPKEAFEGLATMFTKTGMENKVAKITLTEVSPKHGACQVGISGFGVVYVEYEMLNKNGTTEVEVVRSSAVANANIRLRLGI